MRKILMSLVMVVATVAMVAGATKAYLSDTATVDNNTYSTGALELRINGLETKAGFNVTNAAPDTCTSGKWSLNNYGAPWFAGPSTLAAKEIEAKVADKQGDDNLFDALTLKLYANAGWSGCSNSDPFVAGLGCQIYNGDLSSFTGDDVLHHTQWGTHATLAAGSSIDVNYEVCLPNSQEDQNSLQGKTTSFDMVFTAYNPHR